MRVPLSPHRPYTVILRRPTPLFLIIHPHDFAHGVPVGEVVMTELEDEVEDEEAEDGRGDCYVVGVGRREGSDDY